MTNVPCTSQAECRNCQARASLYREINPSLLFFHPFLWHKATAARCDKPLPPCQRILLNKQQVALWWHACNTFTVFKQNHQALMNFSATPSLLCFPLYIWSKGKIDCDEGLDAMDFQHDSEKNSVGITTSALQWTKPCFWWATHWMSDCTSFFFNASGYIWQWNDQSLLQNIEGPVIAVNSHNSFHIRAINSNRNVITSTD